jgi:hypothetical protein
LRFGKPHHVVELLHPPVLGVQRGDDADDAQKDHALEQRHRLLALRIDVRIEMAGRHDINALKSLHQ